MSHRYLPTTERDRQEMMEFIGVRDVEELFSQIPPSVRFQGELNLASALSEPELARYMEELAEKNQHRLVSFLGAGMYQHYIPAVVSHVISRSEFYTAYTPYQPEISQGELQAIFEYQTMICQLTGMEVSNSSMYDGPTAVAEAALMACAITKRDKILVSRAVHPEARNILATYLRGQGIVLKEVDYLREGDNSGQTDLAALIAALDEETAGVVLQVPNFFGVVERAPELVSAIHDKGALAIAYVNPISLGVLEAPGRWGADIVAGEAQPLGLSPSFGGPSCGFLATRDKWVRRMPGRIVGQTADAEGRRGFVLTLQAREQHIRREKATSNICSNQALNALAVAVYLSAMGRQGIREVGQLNLHKAHYACQKLTALPQVEAGFGAPFFNEFVIRSRLPAEQVQRTLLQKGFLAGYHLGRDYPELQDHLLIAVTEMRSKAEIDALVAAWEGLS